MENTILINKKRELTLAFFALIYALILLFVLASETVAGFQDLNGWKSFYYYTYQSNFFVCVWLFGYGITRFCGANTKFGRLATNRLVMTAITTYITITFLVVAFILAPFYFGAFMMGISGSMFFTHLLTPIVMWIYFFFVCGEGELHYRSAWYILAYPLFYASVNLVVGGLVKYKEYDWILIDSEADLWQRIIIEGGDAYAYDFINPHWYPNIFLFILTVGVLTVLFGLLGMGFIRFKRYLDKNYYVHK